MGRSMLGMMLGLLGILPRPRRAMSAGAAAALEVRELQEEARVREPVKWELPAGEEMAALVAGLPGRLDVGRMVAIDGAGGKRRGRRLRHREASMAGRGM